MLDQIAPQPTGLRQNESVVKSGDQSKDTSMLDPKNPSAVKVTLIGCGGGGMNTVRPHLEDRRLFKALYFDTSMVNSRPGESVYTLGTGSGSGSNRAENARDIEREIPLLSDEEMGIGDVVVVVSSLSGGSGSVISPLMIRDLNRRGVRVICIAIADTSSSVGAKNTENTLKTFTSICKNNELYLPMILLSNDNGGRGAVDAASIVLINDLLDILTRSVFEIDRNDRLNWINPTKIVNALPGIKILSLESDKKVMNPKVVIGKDSKEMVDSLLVLQPNHDDNEFDPPLPPARLKKTGIYEEKYRRIVGKISSDIKDVNQIIDFVERMHSQDRSQKHQAVDRLHTSGEDDLIL